MTRVGVLGGTFDPIHWGHLRAAEVVREALELDEVLFVPAASPPHKTGSEVTRPEHRLHMVERALDGEGRFTLSRIEIERRGPSYTIDTLRELGELRPEARFFFIVGTDAFVEIRTWKRWRQLLERHDFVVHERPGASLGAARDVLPEELVVRVIDLSEGAAPPFPGGPHIFLIRRAMLDVSSTEIRALSQRGRSIRFLVPGAVEAYIREHRLYVQEDEGRSRALTSAGALPDAMSSDR